MGGTGGGPDPAAAAADARRPADGALNKSCGQFHPFHGPEFGLFIYGPGHAVGVQSSQEPGKEQDGRQQRQKELTGNSFHRVKRFRNREFTGTPCCFYGFRSTAGENV